MFFLIDFVLIAPFNIEGDCKLNFIICFDLLLSGSYNP